MLRQSWIKYAHFNLTKMRATTSFCMHERDKWLLSISTSIVVVVGLPTIVSMHVRVSYESFVRLFFFLNVFSCCFCHICFCTLHEIHKECNWLGTEYGTAKSSNERNLLGEKKRQTHNGSTENTIACINRISIETSWVLKQHPFE